jgi:plastocyanin
MPKRSVYIISVLIVAVIAAGVWFFVKDRNMAPIETRSPAETVDDLPRGVDIVYTGFSFTPDDIAVASGATVTIINESSEELEFVSDPHPSTDANPELSKSFTITRKGAWGYHNHLSPLKRGRVTVLR